MKITDVRVDGFGIWSDLTIDQLGENLTVFYGPNEAGKTTLMQFMRAVFYGYSGERHQYARPVYGGVAGGKITVSSMNGQYDVVRQGPHTDHPDDRGALDIFSSDGSLQRDHLLDTLLSNLDEPIFNNVFAIGLRELQELATLNHTDAAEQLYRLSSGLDRVSLVDVMSGLETSRDSISGSKKIRSTLEELLHERDRLRSQIEDRANAGRKWGKLASDLTAMSEELTDLQRRIGESQQRGRLLETALQVEQRWRERSNVAAQMEQAKPAQRVTEDVLEKLDQFNHLIGERQKKLDEIHSQRTRIREEANSLPINRELWNHRSRIEALQEHAPWLSSLSKHIHRLDAEIQVLEQDLDGRLREQGVTGGRSSESSADDRTTQRHSSASSSRDRDREEIRSSREERQAELRERNRDRNRDRHRNQNRQRSERSTTQRDAPRSGRVELTTEAIEVLRKAARSAKEATRRLQEAKEVRAQTARSVASIDSQLEREFEDVGGPNVAIALRERGDLVAKLRRRIQLEERLEKMNRNRSDAEEDCLDLLESPDLPLPQFVACAGLLSTGIVVFLLPWFFDSFAAETWPYPAGLFIGIIAWMLKRYFQVLTQTELEDLHRQLSQIKKQIKKAEEEREELDACLPQSNSALEIQLQQAERELERLESLAPIETDHRAAHQRMDEVDERLSRAEKEVRESRERWRAALRRYRLPDDLTPKSIKELIDSHSRLADVQRQLEEKRRERAHRTEEVEGLRQRIEELMLEVGVEIQSDDPHELLRELSVTLAEQRRLVDRRTVLKKQDRELERQREKYSNNIERTKLRKQALTARFGVEEEAEIRELAAELQRYLGYEKEHRDLCERIRVLIGRQFTEEEIAEELDADGSLESRWEKVTTEAERLQKDVDRLHKKQVEVQHEMKMLADDRELARASVALQAVEAKIDELKIQWQLLAAISYVLESIRKIYETERQPETLNDASKFLDAFTEGKYCRIWTPLGENVLRVDDAHGNPIAVESLSTGTREAVFLSLRMALVAAYARRGAVLPLILDDVLVNLDVYRARAAVKVLNEFAEQGHQVLLFTCHEHIMRLFADESVEVRTLPRHSDLASKHAGRLAAVDVDLTQSDVEVWEETEEELAEEEPAEAVEDVEEEPEDEAVEVDAEEVAEEEDLDEEEEEAVEEPAEEFVEEVIEVEEVAETPDGADEGEEEEEELVDDLEEEEDYDEVDETLVDEDAPGEEPEIDIAELEAEAAKLLAAADELMGEFSEEEATKYSEPAPAKRPRMQPAMTQQAQDMWWDDDVA